MTKHPRRLSALAALAAVILGLFPAAAGATPSRSADAVAPTVTGGMVHAAKVKHGVAYYRHNGYARYFIQVSPTSECVTFTIEERIRHRWKLAGESECFPEQPDGTVGFKLWGKKKHVGHLFRAQGTWLPSATVAGGTTPYAYFRYF